MTQAASTAAPAERVDVGGVRYDRPGINGGQELIVGTHRGREMGASPRKAADLDEVYSRCKGPLLQRARGWFPTLRGSEHDLYQTAWASLLGSSRPIEDVEKYLETALYSAGLKELRRRRRKPVVPLASARFKPGGGTGGGLQQGAEALTDRTIPLPDELVQSREDARWLAELLDELTPLQRRIIKLRWGFGLRRRETAALLGVSERSVKRQMEAAQPVIARSVALAQDDRWCESRQSLVIAYTLGVLSPARAAKARVHLERCSACRATARSVRDRLAGVAGLLPLPSLAPDQSYGALARIAEAGDSIRGGVADIASGAKQHALALVFRTPAADGPATQVAAAGGLRGSGSMIATVAACIAAGGGATYCAVEGLPTHLPSLAVVQQEPQRQDPDEDGSEVPKPAQTRPVATLPETQPAEQQPPPPDAPAAQERAETESIPSASPAPAGAPEFGSAPAAEPTSAPAPAPTGGGGEFTP